MTIPSSKTLTLFPIFHTSTQPGGKRKGVMGETCIRQDPILAMTGGPTGKGMTDSFLEQG